MIDLLDLGLFHLLKLRDLLLQLLLELSHLCDLGHLHQLDLCDFLLQPLLELSHLCELGLLLLLDRSGKLLLQLLLELSHLCDLGLLHLLELRDLLVQLLPQSSDFRVALGLRHAAHHATGWTLLRRQYRKHGAHQHGSVRVAGNERVAGSLRVLQRGHKLRMLRTKGREWRPHLTWRRADVTPKRTMRRLNPLWLRDLRIGIVITPCWWVG